MAVALAAGGWLIWAYGWLAETDTGYPDGLGCTGHPAESDAYASCLRSAERAGAIAWALTLGVAVLVLVFLARTRAGRGVGVGLRSSRIAAGVMSASLAVAGVVVWVLGAGGEFYEDRIGAVTWHLAMAIAVAAGLGIGLMLTHHRGKAS